MSNRVKHFTYTGRKDANGRPLEFIGGIPARNLEEADIERLSKEQYAAVNESKIYRPRAERSEPAETKAADKPADKPAESTDKPESRRTS